MKNFFIGYHYILYLSRIKINNNKINEKRNKKGNVLINYIPTY